MAPRCHDYATISHIKSPPFRCCSLIITRLTCSLCGFAFHGVKWHHNYNTITRFSVFRFIAFFTSWPILRFCASPSHRDWDLDVHSARNTWRQDATITTYGFALTWLGHVNTHQINTFPVQWPFLCSVPSCSLKLSIASRLYYSFAFNLPFRVPFSRRDWYYDCACHHVSTTVCVPWRQDAMITTRLHTSNNHLAVLWPFPVFCSVMFYFLFAALCLRILVCGFLFANSCLRLRVCDFLFANSCLQLLVSNFTSVLCPYLYVMTKIKTLCFPVTLWLRLQLPVCDT
jgi:hypothetical protein